MESKVNKYSSQLIIINSVFIILCYQFLSFHSCGPCGDLLKLKLTFSQGLIGRLQYRVLIR